MGLKHLIEILTRFSLFQLSQGDSLVVHRLVQEVIRNNMTNDRKKCILQNATKMVNKALLSTTTPYDLWNSDKGTRGSLYLWNKIAVNANVLKEHLRHIDSDNSPVCDLFFNMESINLLQTTAVFNSLHQRQWAALLDQGQMLHILPTLNTSEFECTKLMRLKIPILQNEREKLQDSVASVIYIDDNTSNNKTNFTPQDPEVLILEGNKAYTEKRYHDAIQYYTEGIRSYSDNNIEYRFLCNRSMAYLRIKNTEQALQDANKCCMLAPALWKAYYLKAYATAKLISKQMLPASMEAAGLASATLAAHLNKDCILKYKMRIYYPIINYIEISQNDNLREKFMSMHIKPFTTLILRKGRYFFDDYVQPIHSVQIIGIEEGVEIDTRPELKLKLSPKEMFQISIKLEQTIYVHFENISFVSEGTQIYIGNGCVATFYKCKFSNGQRGCEKFPQCRGIEGCINPEKCKTVLKSCDSHSFANKSVGEPGFAAIGVYHGGTAYLDSCVFSRCGGGGVMSHGRLSLVDIKNCVICQSRQSGIEAREEGTVKAMNNSIFENQLHGVTIGPKGIGYIKQNTIQNNGSEGVLCTSIEKGKLDLEFGSKAVIDDNIISHNGLSGLSFDGGYFEVRGNKIFENWLWGMSIKSISSSFILNNEIFENKCGGIIIGYNISASVVLDGNTIRDHSGPGVYSLGTTVLTDKAQLEGLPLGDNLLNDTRHPIITNTNVSVNNNKGIHQQPMKMARMIQNCCFCHKACENVLICSECKKATYCSNDCQQKHRKRHEHLCIILHDSFIVEVKLKDTAYNPRGENSTSVFEVYRLPEIADRNSSDKFIVKVLCEKGYSWYDKQTKLSVYDKTCSVVLQFSNPTLYHLCMECGILVVGRYTAKHIFCWASFKDNGGVLCIETDNLPPFQTW